MDFKVPILRMNTNGPINTRRKADYHNTITYREDHHLLRDGARSLTNIFVSSFYWKNVPNRALDVALAFSPLSRWKPPISVSLTVFEVSPSIATIASISMIVES